MNTYHGYFLYWSWYISLHCHGNGIRK